MASVTVIIPSFNRAKLTARAVESVRAQGYRDFEIVVVDDASRPEEVYRAPDAGDIPVRVLRHEVNQGVGGARNTGLAAARGELIAFLDSDDTWFPDKLEKQVAFFRQQPDPDRVLVYSYYYWRETDHYYEFPLQPLPPGRAMSDYLFIDQGCLHVDTWLARKSLLEKVPHEPRLRRSEDWDVLLRMERLGVRFALCPIFASVRYSDGRADRLSTTDDPASERLFHQLNEKNLTPRTYVMLESHLAEGPGASSGRLARYLGKIATIAGGTKLGFWEKWRLAWTYFSARIGYRIRVARARRPIDSTAPF